MNNNSINKNIRLFKGQRRLKIWLDVKEDSSITINLGSAQNFFKLQQCIKFQTIEIPRDHNDFEISILCENGEIRIVDLEINHATIINPKLRSRYQKEIDDLLISNFDLRTVSEDFLQEINSLEFFCSSGSEEFSSVQNLYYNIAVDSDSVSKDQVTLKTGSTMTANLFINPPSIDKTVTDTRMDLDDPDLEYITNFDQEFIKNLDPRYFEFVTKKTLNPNVVWDEKISTREMFPYSYTLRIQAQLLENREFIQDKKILDIGPGYGNFLYPCIVLGCKSVVGCQPIPQLNNVINEGLYHLGLSNTGSVVYGDAYDLGQLRLLTQDMDTVLMLGLIYHLNNHYQLLDMLSRSDITALIIDTSVDDHVITDALQHYTSLHPDIRYGAEWSGIDVNGWEINGYHNDKTWVGLPNAVWIIRTLKFFGWKIKSNSMIRLLNRKKIGHRGIITAYR